MKTKKLSGPAIFMYSAIALTLIVAIISFALYYLSRYDNDIVLWMGIISFMIFYHFGLRIFMGEMTKKLTISYTHPWYKQRKFEKKLYRLLRVRSWKDKV